MRHSCVGERMKPYGPTFMARKSDDQLQNNMRNRCDDGRGTWYDHSNPFHRAYMHGVRVEARKRGLKLPKFNPYAS